MRHGDRPARDPRAVPDDPAEAVVHHGTDVRDGVDTDGDGQPDTLLTAGGSDLLVHTDLDGDGLADRILRIGPDGSVRLTADPAVDDRGDPDELGWLGPDP